jgi:hypothetical protein
MPVHPAQFQLRSTDRSPRATLVLAILAACGAVLGWTPTAAFAAPADASARAAVASAPAPTFKPVWIRRQASIGAGSVALFVLDPVSARRCRISLGGPRRDDRVSFAISGGGRLARIAVHARRNARPGSRALTAICTQPSGPALTSAVSTVVRSHGRPGRGILAARRDIRVRRVSTFADRGRAGKVAGRGAGANPFDPTQCTSLAYDRRQDVFDRAIAAGVHATGLVDHPGFSEDYVWNGKRWAENARRAGIPTGTRPAVGALFVNTTGSYGHVAYVEQVFADGSFQISERNASGSNRSTAVTRSTQYPGRPGIEFVYGGPAAGAEYIGHIVQWDGDTKSQKTAWYVVDAGGHPQRNWIPDSATFYCLKRRGAPGPDVLPSALLSGQLPDQIGVHAGCKDGAGGSDPPATGAVGPAQPGGPAITAFNRVTNGSGAMREDTPAYLSTVRQNYCRRDGCAIAGTERATGGTYSPAVCQAQGPRTTNGEDGNAVDDANPGLFSSTRWYGVRVGGDLGFISEVWIDPGQRGGLGLPGC